MNHKEAQALKNGIERLYPHMSLELRPIGDRDEYVCVIGHDGVFLWSEEDWSTYQERERKRLYYYTERGYLVQQEYIRNRRDRLQRQKMARDNRI